MFGSTALNLKCLASLDLKVFTVEADTFVSDSPYTGFYGFICWLKPEYWPASK